MAHLYVYSPSSTVIDRASFQRGIERLRAQGHEVELDPAVLARHLRFAGDDTERVAAVHRAAASGADVALMARGGYGFTRLLPALRFKAIAKAIERGTQFVGFSDFTAFQLGLMAKTDAVSWAGPCIGSDFGAEVEDDGGPDVIMQACFDDLLAGQGEGAGWRLPAPRGGAAHDDLGIRKATLWGGNLCVLTSLLGTPWFPKVKKGVLFLEDVAEHPYRIERMLAQLLYAGVIDRQRAIVLGRFTDYHLTPGDHGYKLSTAVAWLRSQTRVPVLEGLPMGHVPTKVLLPVGARVSLFTEQRDALIYWGEEARA